MPRQARRKSESGIYHIIQRGINRQKIFIKGEDNHRFLYTLKHYKEISSYRLYAYCIMGNHVHLLLHVENEPLEQIMRRICGSFVYWYNRKYERIGNLFQDRFKSEPVEGDAYFLTVLRYIHQNPYKAGMVKDLEKYMWSSYGAYIYPETDSLQLIDPDFPLKMFNEDKEIALQSFIEFHNQFRDDSCLEVEESRRVSDREAVQIIKSLFKLKSTAEMQNLERKQRDACLKQLKEEHNLSIRQIARLTGINRGIIYRA